MYSHNLHYNQFHESTVKKDNLIPLPTNCDAKTSVKIALALEESKIQQQEAFCFFSQLPTELRLKIWEIFDQEPRIFKFSRGRASSRRRIPTIRTRDSYRDITAPVPVLLHTNLESRQVALKVNKRMAQAPLVFVNPSVDILKFTSFVQADYYLIGQYKPICLFDEEFLSSDYARSAVTNIYIVGRHSKLDSLADFRIYRGLKILTLNLAANVVELEEPESGLRKEWDQVWHGIREVPELVLRRDER